MSPASRSVVNVLMVAPCGGKQAWREWRAGVDLNQLDGDCLAVLPLLAGRLREWLPAGENMEPEREIMLGICKRGWAQNQLRYREAAATVMTLQRARIEPVAIFGPLAWALLYEEEKAVRPIETLDILVARDRVQEAAEALHAAGWLLEPGMPVLEGRVFDQFAGVWWRSRTGLSLQLAWRLWNVSPELARPLEVPPARRPVELQGTQTGVVQTEELLLHALTRERDQLVSWQCDAAVLLRNRHVEWSRLRALAHDFPDAAGKLSRLANEIAAAIPPGILERRPPGRLARIHADYRRVCWASGEATSPPGFTEYLLRRLFRRTKALTS